MLISKLKVGPPTLGDVFMGPLVSQIHLDKVRSYVTIAKEEGGHIHCGETVDNHSLPEANSNVGNDAC